MKKLNCRKVTSENYHCIVRENKFSLLQCNEIKFKLYHWIERQNLHRLHMF